MSRTSQTSRSQSLGNGSVASSNQGWSKNVQRLVLVTLHLNLVSIDEVNSLEKKMRIM